MCPWSIYLYVYSIHPGLPWWLRWERISLLCLSPRFDTWVRKFPWRREWLPIQVFLPEEFHGQRSLVGYSPWGHKKPDMTERLTLSWHISTHRATYSPIWKVIWTTENWHYMGIYYNLVFLKHRYNHQRHKGLKNTFKKRFITVFS